MLPGQRKGVRVQRPGGIVLKGGDPDSQYSVPFIQGMVNRMLTSYHKYGHIKDAVEAGLDMRKQIDIRLGKYDETGNTEWLIDAANYCMIEFMHPSHPDAHYRSTDSKESPGRIHKSGRQTGAKHNLDIPEEWNK